MRTLVVMRHAKSSWADPEQPDRDRPLNGRGRLAAVLMGAWLEEEGLLPEHALLSPARRTLETWSRLVRGAGLGEAPPASELPELYMAEPESSLAALRRTPDEAGVVLLLGHEPGLTGFVRRLHDGRAAAGAARLFEKFPTAAAAVLELPDGPWAQAGFGRARLLRFAAPKDLV